MRMKSCGVGAIIFLVLGWGAVFFVLYCPLAAAEEYWVPALETIAPVGSHPRGNKMPAAEFEAYTTAWRARFARFVADYAPNYAGSADLLGPPRDGRLTAPLPLARGGKAAAEIIADFTPALHTPEATLGRTEYPAETAVMRHTGHIIVENAVNELKHWLDTLTAADFPVVQAPAPGERTRIYVGTHFARPYFAADIKRLGEGEALDGFAVRARGSDIFIFGATTKGTLNGVYAFLENNSDLIWAHSFSDLGTVYTVNPDLDAVWADALEVPGTIQRGWLGHYRERDGKPEPLWMWQMRNRNNFIVAPGPSPKKAEWGCWRENGGHMLGTFLRHFSEPPNKHFPWIPDPVTGELKQPKKIEHYHHNICMTHPDLPADYAKGIVDFFRKAREQEPETPMNALRLGVEDPSAARNYGLCRCERCLRPVKLPDGRIIPVQHAVNEKLTFRATQYYLLLEVIARAMAAEFPDARFSTYAYFFASEPPPFQTLVQPWFCPYAGVPGGQLRQRDYRTPIFSETDNTWWDYAYGWSRMTDLTVLRDYNGLLGNGRPFAEIAAWDLRSLLPMGIKRFTNEIGDSIHDAFAQMDVWVTNRLYWDPEADVAALTAYYLRRTFREGAPAMARFFATIHTWWLTKYDKPEDFILLGWMIDQMGAQEELYAKLCEAFAQVRHPQARANLSRLKRTFEQWYHLELKTRTSEELLENAKLGRFQRFSSFAHAGMPMAVATVALAAPGSVESKDLIVAADRPESGFADWTFSARLRPRSENGAAGLPLPVLHAGSGKPGEAFQWHTPVTPQLQPDGSFLYTLSLKPETETGFDPRLFARIRLTVAQEDGQQKEAPRTEFYLFDLQLTDPAGTPFSMPALPGRLGTRARDKWF